MAHNILLTGVSGYLGGDLLAEVAKADLPEYGKLFALVRSLEQAEAVKRFGAEALQLNIHDENAVRDAVLKHEITIVYFLIDAVSSAVQKVIIKSLGELKKKTGSEVHFLHTTGAKIFSNHSKAPTDRKLSDDDPELFTAQKAQQPHLEMCRQALDTNNTIIELAEANQVKSYIFAPCIVYGEGRGFGNPISIQTVAIVKAAKAIRGVYRVDSGDPIWPVSHIADNTGLYIQILRNILNGQDPGHGKRGYYLASSGSVPWKDIYEAFSKALAKRGVIDNTAIQLANDEILQKMATALNCPKELIAPQLAENCTLIAEHGSKIGWRPLYVEYW